MSFESKAGYFSNEWLEFVDREAKAILSVFPSNDAIDVAASALVEQQPCFSYIPWAVVLTSQGIDSAFSRLLTIVKTPDERTPSNNPDLRPAINNLKKIIYEAGAVTPVSACLVAGHMIQVAVRNPGEEWGIYQDMGRQYPQFAGDWPGKLYRQFGLQPVGEASQTHPELFQIIGKTIIAKAVYKSRNPQREGEEFSEFRKRALSVAAVIGSDALAAMLSLRLKRYVAEAYSIRGLEVIKG